MAPAPAFLSHPSSLEHDTGPHPEQPARMVAVQRAMARSDWLGYERVASPPAAITDLTAVHAAEHVEMIEAAALAGGAQIDADTVVSPGSFTAARHAAGGAVALVDGLLDAQLAPGSFSAHRPPGHHAERARAMGFCLFNNAAVAAAHALGRGLERVMIVDWDVHHGNGTEAIFEDDPRVLVVSIHQSPLYPGTGASGFTGIRDGAGYTVNLPVAAGSGDATFGALVQGVCVPLARAYRPQLVLVSAGFDAHLEDPLADCTVTDSGYARMGAMLRDVCAELRTPFGGLLEGGYALDALGRSVVATLHAFSDVPETVVEPDAVLSVPERRPGPPGPGAPLAAAVAG